MAKYGTFKYGTEKYGAANESVPIIDSFTTTAGPVPPVVELLDPVELQEQYNRLKLISSRFMR